jgi:hypothetical protein
MIAAGFDPGTGYGPPVDIDDVAEGANRVIKRARRADPLDKMQLDPAHRQAARIYRQAVEHMEAGMGMGPLPFGRDVLSGGDGGARLTPQERALSAAVWVRRGVQAMGLAASETVINWSLIRGLPLGAYDSTRRWREGTASQMFKAALERLAVAYGLAQARPPDRR